MSIRHSYSACRVRSTASAFMSARLLDERVNDGVRVGWSLAVLDRVEPVPVGLEFRIDRRGDELEFGLR